MDFTFKLDGKEYTTQDGGSFATKAVDANTWDVVDRMNNKVRGTQHLSLNRDTLTGTGQQIKADGGAVPFSTTWKRVSGGFGFLGQWKSTEGSTSGTLELEANGPDEVTLKFLAKFDGKDCPLTGPTAGDKTTLSLKKIGPRSFEVTQKLSGKAVYADKYTISVQRQTLTDEGTTRFDALRGPTKRRGRPLGSKTGVSAAVTPASPKKQGDEPLPSHTESSSREDEEVLGGEEEKGSGGKAEELTAGSKGH